MREENHGKDKSCVRMGRKDKEKADIIACGGGDRTPAPIERIVNTVSWEAAAILSAPGGFLWGGWSPFLGLAN